MTGTRPSETTIPISLTDFASASVDVATGNLRVDVSYVTMPTATGSTSVVSSYNSLSSATGTVNDYAAHKWTFGVSETGSLQQGATTGSVIYTAMDGARWSFAPVSGSTTAFTSPAGLNKTLTAVRSSAGVITGYTLTDLASRSVVDFTAEGQPTSVKDRNGNAVAISYIDGDLSKVTTNAGPAAGRDLELLYTVAQNVANRGAVIGSGDRGAVNRKSNAADITSVRVGNGAGSLAFGYDASHRLTSIGGSRVTLTYDAQNRVTSFTRATSVGNATTRLDYGTGAQTLVAGPNTDQAAAITAVPRTTYQINSTQKLVTNAVDAAGRTQAATYAPNANVLTSTQGSGAGAGTTTNTYGANGGASRTKSQSPTGASGSSTYGTTPNTAYLPQSSTDSAGNKTLYTFNGVGNQLSSADAAGATAALTYNSDGTVATATSPGNGTNKTTYTYTAATKQLASTTPPIGTSLGVKNFTYDTYGRLATETDGRGNTTTYTYDGFGRITKEEFSSGLAPVTYSYSAEGWLLTSTSATGTITNTYDANGRFLSTENTAGGGTVSYTYDKAGNQVTQTDSFGTYTNTYDAAQKLTASTYPKGAGTARVQYENDAQGRRTGTWLQSNAAHTVWAGKELTGYDTSGRVNSLRAWTGTGDTSNTAVFDTTYCYNTTSAAPTCGTTPANDRSKIQWSRDNLTGQVTTYSYDTQGRVTKVAQTGGAGANTYAYTYDARGNRLTAVVTGATPSSQTLTYNAANQITSAGYAYDGAGNLTANPTTAFTYNAAQQMTQAVKGNVTSNYTYAGADQKAVLSQSVSSGTSYNVTYGKADQNGNPTIVTYTGGTSGAHVYSDPTTGQALMLTTSSDISALYVWDGLGNPVGLLTDFSTNSFSYAYDPYGTRALTAGGTGSGAGQNPYSFKAGIQDRATGLVKFGLRWYESTAGSWTQQDTLDAPLSPLDGNRYSFVGGDPANRYDPTGLNTCEGAIAQTVVSTVVGTAAGIGSGGLALAATAPFAFYSGVEVIDSCSTPGPNTWYVDGDPDRRGSPGT